MIVPPVVFLVEVYLSHLASEMGVDCLCYSDGIPLARTNWPRKVRAFRGGSAKIDYYEY